MSFGLTCMVLKKVIMKILRLNNSIFFRYLLLICTPIAFFLMVYLFCIYNVGIRVRDLAFLAAISPFTFFLVFVINYYLYDKDTIIKIDENGNISYKNVKQFHFLLQDIELCTESFATRFEIGYTEITLKNGDCFYVSNLISLEPIYKLNANIRRENLEIFWPKLLKREKLDFKKQN